MLPGLREEEPTQWPCLCQIRVSLWHSNLCPLPAGKAGRGGGGGSCQCSRSEEDEWKGGSKKEAGETRLAGALGA